MSRFFHFLLISLLLSFPAFGDEPELTTLPLSGRRVDLRFADELTKGSLADGISALKAKGVVVGY